jgi:hypothetical protein
MVLLLLHLLLRKILNFLKLNLVILLLLLHL